MNRKNLKAFERHATAAADIIRDDVLESAAAVLADPEHPMTAPDAEVVSIRGRFVSVLCPYCAGVHVHGVAPGGPRTEHHAAACRPYHPMTPEARAIGYTFNTTPEGPTHA